MPTFLICILTMLLALPIGFLPVEVLALTALGGGQLQNTTPVVEYDKDGAPTTFPYYANYELVCFSGGFAFQDPYFEFSHGLTQRTNSDIKCEAGTSSKSLIDQYNQLRDRVFQIIDKELSDNKQCDDIKRLLVLFKNTEAAVDVHFKRKEELRQEAYEQTKAAHKIQEDFAYRAWTSTQCAMSHIVERNEVYWYLLKELKRRLALGQATIVTAEGETVTDCRNVTAYGSEDLKHFKIDVSQATSSEMLLIYDHYSIADHLKLFSGTQKLVDTDCVSTESPQEKQLNINPAVHTTLTIEVKHNCAQSGGSSWEVHFQCKMNALTPDPCAGDLDKLIKALEDFLNNTKKILNNFANYSLCYEDLQSAVSAKLGTSSQFGAVLTRTAPNRLSRVPLKAELSEVGEAKTPEGEIVGRSQELSTMTEAGKTFEQLNSPTKDSATSGLLVPQHEKGSGTGANAAKVVSASATATPRAAITPAPGQHTEDHKDAAIASQAQDLEYNSRNYCGRKKDHLHDLWVYVTWAYCQHAYPRLLGQDWSGGRYE